MSDNGQTGLPRRGPLLEVLSLRDYRRWLVVAQLAHLPLAMRPLAFLLLATAATGNYRLGGVMVAAAVVAEVLFASPGGRLVDRRSDPRRLLSVMLLTDAVALTLLAAAGELSGSAFLLVSLAVLSSGLSAGAPAGLRRILQDPVPDRLMTPALAVEGVAAEFTLVIGPVLVAAIVPIAQAAGVGAIAVILAVAAVLVRGLPPLHVTPVPLIRARTPTRGNVVTAVRAVDRHRPRRLTNHRTR